MTVYFIESMGRIKIGHTTDIAARVKSLTTGSAHPLHVLCTVDGGRDVEKALHRKLAHHRIKHEWFDDCADVRRAIADYQRYGIGSVRGFYNEADKLKGRQPRPLPAAMFEVESNEDDRWDDLFDRAQEVTREFTRRISELELLRRIGVPVEKLRCLSECIHSVGQSNSLALTEIEKQRQAPNDRAYACCVGFVESAEARVLALFNAVRTFEASIAVAIAGTMAELPVSQATKGRR
jgi:hypothetical protein